MRQGNKHRPFYRVVVAKSLAGRNSAAVEILGQYNPLIKGETGLRLKTDRALYWLMNGAQPTETAAYLLKRAGVLEEFFKARPNAKAKYKFLDKRSAAMSKASVVEPVAVAAPAAEAVAVKEEAPAAAEEATPEAAAEAPTAEATTE